METALFIEIDGATRVPKYKQVVDSIISGIANGKFSFGEKIPSINELSETCDLSRDTVEKAYGELKERKIITAVKGKGFYIARTDLISKLNVFFMVNKPSSYKLMIYNSFANALGMEGHVTLAIYHCDESLFIRKLQKNHGAHDYYVIMPHFKNEHMTHVSITENVLKEIEKIPKDKLLILDNNVGAIKGNYGAIYQDFKKDIYNALKEGINYIQKYDSLILVYPNKSIFPYPKGILQGFTQFCGEYNFNHEILDEIYDDMELKSKDLYIMVEESDLVNLVQQVKNKNLILGKDIGIISYNDTPLKSLLGITVIGTDFKAMGETAAYMVLKNKKEKVKNVFRFIKRHSV